MAISVRSAWPLLVAAPLLAAAPAAKPAPVRPAAPRPPASAADAPVAYTFSAASKVRYTLVHRMHTVVGTSGKLDGTVSVAGGDVAVPFTVRVPLASFSSGNASRDANALQALGALRFPAAVLVVERLDHDWKTYKPGTVGGRLDFKGTAHGTLALHGVTRPVAIPVTGWAMPLDAFVGAKFAVSLAEYGIPAPKLLFIPVEDRVEVEVEGVASRAAK
jgi:polyisoprenoid-binding protein YceI